MINLNPVKTSLDLQIKLIKVSLDESAVDITLYQQKLGSLMYLITCTCPDIAYPVSLLSYFCSYPLASHHQAVNRVFHYLSGTHSLGLSHYHIHGSLSLTAFSDAAYGNCWDTKHSWQGYCFLLGSCLVSWHSTKQHSVSTSTAEAEYMALSTTARQASWYLIAFKELDIRVPVTLNYDNTTAIDLSQHTIISQRMKHIDIHYHYVRECLLNNKFNIEYIESSNNTADIFTKALDAQKHSKFVKDLGCTV